MVTSAQVSLASQPQVASPRFIGPYTAQIGADANHKQATNKRHLANLGHLLDDAVDVLGIVLIPENDEDQV